MSAPLGPIRNTSPHSPFRKAEELFHQIDEVQKYSFLLRIGDSRDKEDDKKARLRHKRIQEEKQLVMDSPSFHQELTKSLEFQSTQIGTLANHLHLKTY